MPQQYFIRINKSDPRYANIKQRIRQLAAQGRAIDTRLIKALYYRSGGANRQGQSTLQNYSQMVQHVMQQQNALPTRVIRQHGMQFHDINLSDVAVMMVNNPMDFIHFKRVNNVRAVTRLYIPANLARVGVFMDALWRLGGLTGFKVAGFQDAQDRTDVIVAWFQHSQHARAVGAEFDQTYTNYFSGVYPPGSRPCSHAQHCGWSIEEANFSVGTESTEYLAHWWASGGQDADDE